MAYNLKSKWIFRCKKQIFKNPYKYNLLEEMRLRALNHEANFNIKCHINKKQYRN